MGGRLHESGHAAQTWHLRRIGVDRPASDCLTKLGGEIALRADCDLLES